MLVIGGRAPRKRKRPRLERATERTRLLASTTIRIVRDEPKVPSIKGRGKWTFNMDWVATTQVAAAACVLAVALLALCGETHKK